jgi:hypothetical protein
MPRGHEEIEHLDPFYGARWTGDAPLRPSVFNLLRVIADNDAGEGVDFEDAPRGRWRLAGGDYVVNADTFHVLNRLGLIDVGNGHLDPTRITEAGRVYLAERKGARRGRAVRR